MAVVFGKIIFRQLMKKLIFKNGHHNRGYKKIMNNDDEEKTRPSKGFDEIYLANRFIRGYIPIHVGEERKRYLVPINVADTEAFKALLKKYEDDLDQSGTLAVPLSSIEDFKCVLRLAIARRELRVRKLYIE